MVIKGSCPKKNECMHPHIMVNDRKHKRKVCYFEMVAVGNCRRGSECHFPHDITEDERNNVQFRKEVEEECLLKKNMCINEYMRTNSCLKKEACSFRHSISTKERQCPATQEKMTQKWRQITGKTVKPAAIVTTHGTQQVPPLHVVEEMRTFMGEMKKWMRNRP